SVRCIWFADSESPRGRMHCTMCTSWSCSRPRAAPGNGLECGIEFSHDVADRLNPLNAVHAFAGLPVFLRAAALVQILLQPVERFQRVDRAHPVFRPSST